MPDFDDEEAQDREDLRIAEERLQAIREGREKTIPLEDVMRRLGLEPFIDLELGAERAVVSPAATSDQLPIAPADETGKIVR